MPPPHSSGLRIYTDNLPYASKLEARDIGDIDLVVIHCTELPDIETARAWGERIVHPSGTGNSGHWYIDRNGAVLEYVPPERIAHHVRGYNARAVGIELVNRGRFPDWLDSRRQTMEEPYPPAQVDALLSLLDKLQAELPSLRFIAGHEDLDTEAVPASDDPATTVQRKRDPGPLFPWTQVLEASALQRIP